MPSFEHLSSEGPKKPRRWHGASVLVHLVILSVLLFFAKSSFAQVRSNNSTVNLLAILGTSLGVSASPGTVNFSMVPNGAATGDSLITITTTWSLPPATRRVSLFAYFTSAAAALTNGAGRNIPSSNVAGSPNGGPFTAFTGNSPFGAGTSLQIFTQRLRRRTRNATRTDTLNLRINTAGLGLPSGTYTGVMHFRAQAL
jgi:hypothetical protein